MRATPLAWLAALLMSAAPLTALAGPYSVGDRPSEIVGREIWSNKVISTDDYLGRWLLIDFFATWCGPCVHELPNLVAETADLRGPSFEVLAISVDFPNTQDRLKPMLKEHGADYPCIYQGGGWQTPPVKEWGVNGIPAIFLLNPQGVIVASGLRGERLRPALEYFLNAAGDLPPLSLSVTPAEVSAGAPLSLQINVVNPTRSPLELKLEGVQYVPVFAEDDPERKGRPVDYSELPLNADGAARMLLIDCSDWGFGSHSMEVPLDPDGYYFSLEYSVQMPGSVTAENPDGVWLGGDFFTPLPALKEAQERQKAEREAAEAAKE